MLEEANSDQRERKSPRFNKRVRSGYRAADLQRSLPTQPFSDSENAHTGVKHEHATIAQPERNASLKGQVSKGLDLLLRKRLQDRLPLEAFRMEKSRRRKQSWRKETRPQFELRSEMDLSLWKAEECRPVQKSKIRGSK